MRRLVVLLLLPVAIAAAGCGGAEDEDAADTASATLATQPATTASCRDVEEPEPKPAATLEAPTSILSTTTRFDAHVETSCGEFTIRLDPQAAPRAAASFVALARAGFYDGTVFHRIVPGFVIQGGDPTATGAGGPGYTTVDRPAKTTTYTEGVVAMAKGSTEAAGTAGSQFFVVTASDAGLPPDYAVIGKVTRGLDVVQQIGVLGDPNTELPTQPVVVERVRIETSS